LSVQLCVASVRLSNVARYRSFFIMVYCLLLVLYYLVVAGLSCRSWFVGFD
jgi:hypothetical protein